MNISFDFTNYQQQFSEADIKTNEPNQPNQNQEDLHTQSTVVKDLCFVAWIAQACSQLRGAPTKAQALAMVEEYFGGSVKGAITSGKQTKPKKHKAAKEGNEDCDKFIQWVREQILEEEGRELISEDINKYVGVFHYYKRFGSEAPYERARTLINSPVIKVAKKGLSDYKAWLAKNERAKGAPLTDKETTSLRNKWYKRPDKGVEPPLWDNRGQWPVCRLHAYPGATGIEVAMHAGAYFNPYQAFRDIAKAEERLKQLDEWMIQLREGRTPEQVYYLVTEFAESTPQ